MKELRSASQILFGYLPEQTVDLRGRVWKVREWRNPIRQDVDDGTLRRELIKLARPWTIQGRDGGYGEHLFQGRAVEVLSVSKSDGVSVEPFPEVWLCRHCGRIADSSTGTCSCGGSSKGQLHFVGYCSECGALRAPYIPKCREHRESRVVFPGTASAAEIAFTCPACDRVLRNGFGFPNCECGRGRLTFNVHRSASVFTPRTVVLVNPPSQAVKDRLVAAGGPARALGWVLGGLETRSAMDQALSRDSMRAQLVDQGLSPELVESLVEQAAKSGELDAGGVEEIQLTGLHRDIGEAGAVTLATATAEARLTVADLTGASEEWSGRGALYRHTYPQAITAAGLEAVELVDKFPVLTGVFGYTRGPADPGESRMVPFRDARGGYIVHGSLADTEALLFRLDPQIVAEWLDRRSFGVGPFANATEARLGILRTALPPEAGSEPEDTAGCALLTLVHSYAHLVIRRIAALAGIDRNALSELLVPSHAAFFVFAAARGDFILGGLQAVFETDLHTLLKGLVSGDHRCPLDPGCTRAGSACMACLHIGEPSCRFYNGFLSRSALVGHAGYLSPASHVVPSPTQI